MYAIFFVTFTKAILIVKIILYCVSFCRQTGALCKDLSLQSETKDNLAAKVGRNNPIGF